MHELERGDILLYTSQSIEDSLIAYMTHGIYSHAAIAVSNDEVIQATSDGVYKSLLVKPNYVIPISHMVSNERLDYGIAFLFRQLGKRYSWFDIMADSVKAILPKSLSGTPFLTSPYQFDCSALAVAFLLSVGTYPLPDSFYVDAGRVAPNDLWRWSNSK